MSCPKGCGLTISLKNSEIKSLESELADVKEELAAARKKIEELEAARVLDKELRSIASHAIVRAGLETVVRRECLSLSGDDPSKRVKANDRSAWARTEQKRLKYHGPSRIVDSYETLLKIFGAEPTKRSFNSDFFENLNEKVHQLDLNDKNAIALFVYGARQMNEYQAELEDIIKTAAPTNAYWSEDTYALMSPTLRPRAYTMATAPPTFPSTGRVAPPRPAAERPRRATSASVTIPPAPTHQPTPTSSTPQPGSASESLSKINDLLKEMQEDKDKRSRG